MKPLCILAITSLCLFSLNIRAQQKPCKTTKDRLEARIFTTVEAVPEVEKFMKQGHHHQLIIDDEPHTGFKYYVVKMGYGGDMFLTLERFCVDPQTMKAYY